jgi:hypothetical protein
VPSLSSLVGAATAGYSIALVAAPSILIKPAQLENSTDIRTLVRGIGVRDTAIGTAMVLAPAGTARRLVVGARIAADLGDAGVFGAGLAGRGSRTKVVAFAAAWGLLSLVAGVLDERSGR